MNKKTAIITWIKYNNYGTFLQAYALQKTLLINDIDSTILNDIYIKNELNNKKRHGFVKKYFKFLIIFNFYNLILKNKYKKLNDIRNKQFVKFKENYLKVSNPIDSTELSKLNEEYDIFICGSDQIWAPKDEIFNEYYYLGFVNSNKLKIAYAPSIGLYKIPDDKKEKISSLINRINYISVREEQGANLLKELTSKDIEVVLDPTLLINSSQWNSIIPERKRTDSYILCYFLGSNNWYREYIRKFSKKNGLKIIILPMCFADLKLGDYSETYSGPADFLGLIRDAEYVFTDSFHGTIFSILFNKKFITFKRFDEKDENCQNSRVYNLLNKVQLLNRFIGNSNNDDIEIIEKDINYRLINQLIEKERKKSLDFLFSILNKFK